MDQVISKTQDLLNFVSQDKDFLRDYDRREMMLSDWTTGINTVLEKGEAQGIIKGLEQGMVQKEIEIVRNMLAEGLPLDIIQKVTGLNPEAIDSLK
jgi:predicted transposase/invertase (TIGR01784 family)